MKAIRALAMLIVAGALGFLILTALHGRMPSVPQTLSYSLLPQQTLTIANSDFSRIEIRAQYPVRIEAGDCYSSYTVQWTCTIRPANVLIVDQRPRPIFSTPPANVVTVRMGE